jgi:hypothetical protein
MIAFVDAESDLGAALAARTESHVAPIPAGTVAAWRAQLGKPASLTAARVEPWVTHTLLRERRPPSIDHRVKRVLRALPGKLAEAEAGVIGCCRHERQALSVAIPASVHHVSRRSTTTVRTLVAFAVWGP